MTNPVAQRTSTTRLAIVATAVAVTLAIVFAVASVRAEDNAVHGAMSRGMTATDEGDYLVEMIAHHDEAVAAATELSRSDRSEVRELGRAIVTSQSAQIVQMRSWIGQWHDDAGPAAYDPMMRDLSGLTGDDLDRTFLEDMVMHHWMAVMMSRHLLAGSADLHREVAALARDIVREQTLEIRLMRRWSADWFGGTLGHRFGQSSRTRSPRRGTTAHRPRSSSIRPASAAEPSALRALQAPADAGSTDHSWWEEHL